MGQEIERKFLVNREAWQLLDKPLGKLLRQGYLLTDPDKTIRVRISGTTGFLTIKGLTKGATRLEYEYAIPAPEAIELLDNFAISELTKTRYEIVFANKKWEVDEFLGDNQGLMVAEIELQSEEEAFELPGWLDREVTGEEKYYNANLTMHPFNQWR